MSIKTFEHGKLSLWQSAIEEVLFKRGAASQTSEPGSQPAAASRIHLDHPLVSGAADHAAAHINNEAIPGTTADGLPDPDLGAEQTAAYFSKLHFDLAEAKVKLHFTKDPAKREAL